METSASGLTAQRLRMDVIAHNIANAATTRTAAGTPYRRRVPVFAAREAPDFGLLLSGRLDRLTQTGLGVRVSAIREDQRPFRLHYDPAHPDADAEGYVALPNVDVLTEMVDLITATRAYEAGVAAMEAARSIAVRTLEIGRG